MAYISRSIENSINEASKYFSCIVLYGPRQVGKSTTIEHLFKNKIRKITMDNGADRTAAISNPKEFLESYGWPLIIDEIQKVPELLDQIKITIDNQKSIWLENNEQNKLMYILTGSNRFELEKQVSESLAGRAAILEMNSLSGIEKNGSIGHLFNPNIENLLEKERRSKLKYKSKKEIFEEIFKGGMPEYIDKNLPREIFFSSYIDTYIEKDVKQVISKDSEINFRNFISLLALRTGTQINYQDISNKVGIDVKTVKKWLSILESSGIIYLLEPYLSNMSDRIIKAPKLYFMDTGLCAYLCKWPNAEMLENGVMSGAFFETYVVSDLIKNLQANMIDPKNYLYYYRDTAQKEVDILYVDVNGITPIEVKKSTSPSNPTKNFDALNKYKQSILTGLVIDTCEKILPINESVYSYPVWRLGE